MTIDLLPVVTGVLLLICGLRAFGEAGTLHCVYLTVAGAFLFWYWVPAVNLLTAGYLGPDEFTPSRLAVRAAVWTTLSYEIAVVATLWLIRPVVDAAVAGPGPDRLVPSAAKVATIVLVSAATFLAVRFAKNGLEVFVNLIIGLSSARDTTTYFNQSEDAGSSLLGLWEIVNIWLALFVVSYQTRRHYLLSVPSMMGIAAIALIFIGNGTRAVLLQMIFVGALSFYLRPAVPAGVKRARPWLYLAPLAAVFSLFVAGFASRFRDNGGGSPVVDALIVNPDMTRELAFIIDQLPNYRNGSPTSFMLQPVAFILPRFLGFARGIPQHLDLYNQARGGVDLEFGQGNLFPGIIADFHMVFAGWGPLAFAAFVALYTLVLARVGRLIHSTFLATTFVITCSSYLFFSFRNIAGMLFLVIIFGFLVCWAMLHQSTKLRASVRPRS